MGITDKGMQALATGADQWLTDDGARGEGRLVGRITPAGERAFYFRHTTAAGKRDTLKIGSYHPKGSGGLTLAQARAVADDWRRLYARGIKDLRAHFAQQLADERQAAEHARQAAARAAELDQQRHEAERRALDEAERAAAIERERRISVRALFERWCAVDLKPHTRTDGRRAGRKDGGAYTRDQFERRVFPVLGDRAVADVTKADLMAILDTTKAEGKLRTANVLLADLKQMFAFAVTRDVIPRDPLADIKRRQVGGAETQRDRILTPDELAALAKALPVSRLNKRSAAAVWLLLGTVARAGELMGTAWAEHAGDLKQLQATADAVGAKVGVVDLKARTWHLPDTKNQRDHTIHLSDFAVTQFERLAALREQDANGKPVPWVFPNTAQDGPVCVKSFGKQLADRQLSARKRTEDDRMRGRSKATDSLLLPGGKWTAHDLRRTGATLMASMGISGDVIDECLNHVIESRVRRTYIRDRRPQEQARAFDALGVRLASIISGQPAATNVVALPVAA